MNSRARTTLAALVLCAMGICAFAAASASAAGMTAVKCVEVAAGTGSYETNACLTPKVEKGNFATVVIVETREIEGTATTASHALGSTNNPVVIFKSTIAGIKIQITCGKTSGTGKVTNVEVGSEMKIHGTESVVTYSECHVAKQEHLTEICQVQGTAPATAVGEIKTNKLTGTNVGTEHTGQIEPEAAGGAFTEFKIIGGAAPCFTAVNLAVKVTGKLQGIANTVTHSHGTFEPATNGTEFKANGAAATFESTTTAWLKGNESEKVGAETF
jgi:hypothetical protein